MSQFAPLVAVHGRSGVAVTAINPFAPSTLAVDAVGLTLNESAAAGRPCCVTVNVSVPIVTVPVRAVRAPFLKLRLSGVGPCTVYGLHAVYEK